jgi:flavin-binding protein dodecin
LTGAPHRFLAAAFERKTLMSGRNSGGAAMSEHVYKILELVGSSATSIEDAIQSALTRAGETLRNIRWFQVMETRGVVDQGKVSYYQVTLKVGFTLEG